MSRQAYGAKIQHKISFQVQFKKYYIYKKYKKMEITVTIKFIDMNLNNHTFQISNNTTGYQLKTYIYNHVSQSLTQHQMELTYEGATIANNQKLSEFNITVGKFITFKQQKIDLSKVSNIIAACEDDPISGETTLVTKMKCGHSIARDTMIALIRSLLDEHLFQIRCPNVDQNGAKCLMEWDFKDCKKIGVFTLEETNQFEEGLSKNWLKSFGKQCPTCTFFIYKGDLKTNRVKCPACKGPDFCYICLQPWKGGSGNQCGSATCKFYTDQLVNCPWDRVFNLKDKTKQNQIIQVNTPKLRMCPNCSITIENYANCKHTDCKACKKSFCWVCLEVLNGKWTCGGFQDYCGKVAQVQKLK